MSRKTKGRNEKKRKTLEQKIIWSEMGGKARPNEERQMID